MCDALSRRDGTDLPRGRALLRHPRLARLPVRGTRTTPRDVTGSHILEVDPGWREAHPGASVGLIAMRGVANPASNDYLSDLAAELEAIRAIPPLPAYAAYYKRWGQRYHVAMQLEAVAQKGKALPRVAALVEAMFIAELR